MPYVWSAILSCAKYHSLCSNKCYSKILDIILKYYFYSVLFLLFDYLKCSVFGNCNVTNSKRVFDQRHCHQSSNISQTLRAKLSQFSVVLITIMRQPKQKPPVELPPFSYACAVPLFTLGRTSRTTCRIKTPKHYHGVELADKKHTLH